MRYSDTLGRIIRSVREGKGYSQEYLAEMLDISQSAYANLESGKSNLSVDRLLKVCEILGLDVHELLDRSGQAPTIDNGFSLPEGSYATVLSPEIKQVYGELIGELRNEIAFLRSLIKKDS